MLVIDEFDEAEIHFMRAKSIKRWEFLNLFWVLCTIENVHRDG